MYKALNGALIALGVIGATLAMQSSGNAQDIGVHVGGVGIGVDFGNVAYAYNDGYWDHGHQWHQWRDDREMNDYRHAHADQYNDYRHDRDHDQGWHQ